VADVETNAPDKTVAGILGQITWLATQSTRHKTLFVSDLEWLVMPAIILQQFKIFHKDGKPIGCVLWAKLSDEVAERIKQPNFRLQPQDWRSGTEIKIVDIIALQGAEDDLKAAFEAEVAKKAKMKSSSGVH